MDLATDNITKFVKRETASSGIVYLKEGFKMPMLSMED